MYCTVLSHVLYCIEPCVVLYWAMYCTVLSHVLCCIEPCIVLYWAMYCTVLSNVMYCIEHTQDTSRRRRPRAAGARNRKALVRRYRTPISSSGGPSVWARLLNCNIYQMSHLLLLLQLFKCSKTYKLFSRVKNTYVCCNRCFHKK